MAELLQNKSEASPEQTISILNIYTGCLSMKKKFHEHSDTQIHKVARLTDLIINYTIFYVKGTKRGAIV
uniref:Uncharacterized protein n=1 Tax=Populus trichocarpa TaxID=3694 RepID=A0A2K2AY86_POPTR